jgi:DNA mismatch endonuclease, patch repair protein
MADVFSRKKRSIVMSRIRSKNTAPEMMVRRLVHSLGFRYRLYASDLPGKPDLVFRQRRKVIFVHGCFWHCHVACIDGHKPKTNTNYWRSKLSRNKERDKKALFSLKRLGWEVMVIWECEIQSSTLKKRVCQFLTEQVE